MHPCPSACRSSRRNRARSTRRRTPSCPPPSRPSAEALKRRSFLGAGPGGDGVCFRSGHLSEAKFFASGIREKSARYGRRAAGTRNRALVRSVLSATGTMPALIAAEECRRKVDGIEQTEQHTLFGPYVQARERVGAAIHSRGQLAKRIAAPVVDERDLPRTARREVTLDEIVRRVVDPRDLHPWRAHPVIGSARIRASGRCRQILAAGHGAVRRPETPRCP